MYQHLILQCVHISLRPAFTYLHSRFPIQIFYEYTENDEQNGMYVFTLFLCLIVLYSTWATWLSLSSLRPLEGKWSSLCSPLVGIGCGCSEENKPWWWSWWWHYRGFFFSIMMTWCGEAGRKEVERERGNGNLARIPHSPRLLLSLARSRHDSLIISRRNPSPPLCIISQPSFFISASSYSLAYQIQSPNLNSIRPLTRKIPWWLFACQPELLNLLLISTLEPNYKNLFRTFISNMQPTSHHHRRRRAKKKFFSFSRSALGSFFFTFFLSGRHLSTHYSQSLLKLGMLSCIFMKLVSFYTIFVLICYSFVSHSKAFCSFYL